jgi:hypothetical protein
MGRASALTTDSPTVVVLLMAEEKHLTIAEAHERAAADQSLLPAHRYEHGRRAWMSRTLASIVAHKDGAAATILGPG